MLETIDIMRRYIPTIAGGSIAKYEQAIADARSWIISTLLGREFMIEIEAMNPKSELYRCTERLLAYKAYQLAIPKLDLVETANGFAVVNDEKLAPASRDRVTALVASFEASITQAVGELLDYLEDTPAYRGAWSNSPAFTVMTDSFLPTLREFRRYGSFVGNNLDFMAERPAFQSVILRYIEPRISRELTRAILDEVAVGNVSESHERILSDLKFALAAFYNERMELGEQSIARVRRVLEADPDAFPAFKTSELYAEITAPAPEKKEQPFFVF